MSERYELAVVGGGPAGLSAALMASKFGVKTVLVDENRKLGGQLVKQTHKFFGSYEHMAGIRGIAIGRKLSEEVMDDPNITVMLSTTAIGYYEDGTLALYQREPEEKLIDIKPQTVIFATGARENMLAFPGNDLPGVYGAGAVQTLMNVYGVLPGERVLMIGSGNIGLIVTYQLLQAGSRVEAIVEILPRIGGYIVHASKVRRYGVPILTRHTIIEAIGDEKVEGAVIAQVDERFRPIPGTERELDVDVICLAVGLAPIINLTWQAGVEIAYIPELGGHVPWHDEDMRTNVPNVFVAGDLAGIEEATTAMIEGELAALSAVEFLGKASPSELAAKREDAHSRLEDLRLTVFSEKVKAGIEKLKNWRADLTERAGKLPHKG